MEIWLKLNLNKEFKVRGIIYDRRGMELALSQDSSTIGINLAKFMMQRLLQISSQISKHACQKIESMILEKANYFY